MIFYDTCALLNAQHRAFEEQFYLSLKTLEELEHIKEDEHKSQEVRFKARKLIRLLLEHQDKYSVVIPNEDTMHLLTCKKAIINNDSIITACAVQMMVSGNQITFCSDDGACYLLAKKMFGIPVKMSHEIFPQDLSYNGYRMVVPTDEELASFYTDKTKNIFDCLTNEYLVLSSAEGKILGVFKWDGDAYVSLYNKGIKSAFFGEDIRAKDFYQSMVIDSIMTNQITAITGFGGTGKSLLAVASALHLMDYCGYERIVVMFNPEKARGGKDMGFYEGSMLKKALKHNIGNMLSSKFGSEGDLEDMLRTDRIRLIPIVDGRGMEVGNNEILYVTEAQNTNNDLMELVLTRPSAQAKVIIEGDDKAQVDNRLFEHEKNGLRNMINAYKGESIFGYTHLTTIYRSKVAELAQRLRED